jgi:nucleotide-binding universal stress UspA family protein
MSLETVLLAVDTENDGEIDELAATAVDIAGPAGATVVLAHVFSEEAYESARENLKFDPNSEVTPSVVAKRTVSIREARETLADAGVDSTVEARLTNGDGEGDRIADLADELDADLVIVGGRGRTPAGKAVFGSTAQTVLLAADCPVTYVRNE